MFIIGQRHRPGALRIEHRQRDRVALDRINPQIHAEGAQQGGAVYAETDDITICGHPLRRTVSGDDIDTGNAVGSFPPDGGDGGTKAELHAARGAQRGELVRETMGITGFVIGRIGAAHDARAERRQRRFQRNALVGRLRHQRATRIAQQAGGVLRALPFVRIGVEVQDAARQLVVVDAGLGTQRAQQRAAVTAQRHQLPDVMAQPRRRAFAQKGDAPAPLLRIGAQAEQQRRILASQPAQQLQRRPRIRPRHGVRC